MWGNAPSAPCNFHVELEKVSAPALSKILRTKKSKRITRKITYTRTCCIITRVCTRVLVPPPRIHAHKPSTHTVYKYHTKLIFQDVILWIFWLVLFYYPFCRCRNVWVVISIWEPRIFVYVFRRKTWWFHPDKSCLIESNSWSLRFVLRLKSLSSENQGVQ